MSSQVKSIAAVTLRGQVGKLVNPMWSRSLGYTCCALQTASLSVGWTRSWSLLEVVNDHGLLARDCPPGRHSRHFAVRKTV
jgi:hypothetical protein